MPLYPQYSTTTTASVEDVVRDWQARHPQVEVRTVHDYADDPQWAEAVAHVLPDDRLTMTITPDSQDGRELSLLAGGATSATLRELIA